jgi:hypothetical protein
MNIWPITSIYIFFVMSFPPLYTEHLNVDVFGFEHFTNSGEPVVKYNMSICFPPLDTDSAHNRPIKPPNTSDAASCPNL